MIVSTSSYGPFVILRVVFFQNLKILKARKIIQISVKERVFY